MTSVKFLLVDDLDDNLEALKELLVRDDLEILTARSGHEALDLLQSHDIALALLDVQMPHMDGFELAERIRSMPGTRHVPIIFVTAGMHDQRRAFKGYEAGAVDFLFKPIDSTILRHKTETFFELYRQRQQLADQLQQLEESAIEREKLVAELSETVRVASMFTAVLSHDLRSPLGVIALCTEVLQKEATEERSAKMISRIASNGRRVTRLIDDVLDVARARLSGGLSITKRPCDLLPLCERVVADHRMTSNDRVIKLACAGDSQGAWDDTRLVQALSNLVAVSLHYSLLGTPIYLYLDGKARDTVTVTARNEGVIPPELAARLLEPFDASRTRTKPEGVGIGLYIAQQVAAVHGGSVDVESSADTGTRMTMRLPRRG